MSAGRSVPPARPLHERIDDPDFRRAVTLLDDGDPAGLREHLRTHPALTRQRIDFPGEGYFRNPSLLEFVAGNPSRHERLPANIVELAAIILEAGAASDRASVESTLALVSSSRLARESGAADALIELLCDHGADPGAGLLSALVQGDFAAARVLLRRGAPAGLEWAASTGEIETARRELPAADGALRHRALALSAQHGHADVVRLLLDAGEDAGRTNPVGCHAHSTPLHQAALAGHAEVVQLLVERGAPLDVRDTRHGGTPREWAEHAGQAAIAEALRAAERA